MLTRHDAARRVQTMRGREQRDHDLVMTDERDTRGPFRPWAS